ncbi:MAG TPA: FtsX-like permease family protein [Micromonosporaceae bacterium]
MLRLGVHMILRSGREALVRLVITMAAVGVGVALLLSVLAIYHGYETTAGRACWQCTGEQEPGQPGALQPQQSSATSSTVAANAELWDYSEDFYRGRTIERANVAALGPGAPIVPGLTRVPSAGQYYASPALAKLIATVPRNELADRFPGGLVGEIGSAGLSGPDDLAIVIGYPPAALAHASGTSRITTIQTSPHNASTSDIYTFAFGLGAIALLVPMLILIGNATRLAAARREERYAAMRLVGATTRQVGVIASVDAILGAALGTMLGIAFFAALRPLAAQISITGSRFFPDYITPTWYGYLGVLVGVPVAAAITVLLSMRRVGISPLGVSRRTTPPPPRLWRIFPLLIGLLLFVVPLLIENAKKPAAGLALLSLCLIMVGLLVGGTWLTMQASRVLARVATGASSLLAARRMADNPRGAFRSVSGLVLAVFVGTFLAGAVPAALAAQQTPTDAGLNQLLRVTVGDLDGLAPAGGATLAAQLRTQPGATVFPIYVIPNHGNDFPPVFYVISCADLARLPALGRCPAGATAVQADLTSLLYTDNIASLNRQLPLITPSDPPVTQSLASLHLGALLVRTNSAAALERVRTFIAVSHPDIADPAPQTIGEVAQVRAALYLEAGNVVLLLVAVTLLVAGCSLAIAMGGGMVERKRPFTLLRVSGTATRVLRRVLLLESILPLIVATVVAAVAGLASAIPVGIDLAPAGAPGAIQLPGHTYFLTMGAGLLISLALVAATVPLLNRMTVPDNARFE